MNNLFQILLTATKETINNVDLSHNIDKVDSSFLEYYTAPAGSEHYRLLSYMSSLINGSTFLDIGTYRGYSAIALSQNQNNKVVSYDIGKFHTQKSGGNVEYRIGNAIEFEHFHGVSVILLDTVHDGIFEDEFINHLRSIGWSGVLIMDDIHHFPKLNVVYNELTEVKHDITSIGHWSGTGAVLFGV